MEATQEPQGDLLGGDNPQETTPWYGEESAELVANKGWKTPDDALKSYSELEKMTSGRVKMPTPESSAEEIRAFYQKTGCPENPEGYEVTVPEGLEAYQDKGIEDAMKAIAHEQGVSKQAFESIVRGYYEKLNNDMHASREAGEAALKEEFGDKYEESVTIANRFFDTCSEEFCSLVKASGLANNPVFIKEFLAKGRQTMADTLVKGDGGGSGGNEESYRPQYADSPDMYRNGDSEESEKARAYFTARGHKY